MDRIYIMSNLDTYKIQKITQKWFSKQHITHESVFFLFLSFMIQGSDKSLISDGPSFLWSSCSNVSCWIWHREKKSWNSIGYCSRKVYWKILHCRLRRISTNALTHSYLQEIQQSSTHCSMKNIASLPAEYLPCMSVVCRWYVVVVALFEALDRIKTRRSHLEDCWLQKFKRERMRRRKMEKS